MNDPQPELRVRGRALVAGLILTAILLAAGMWAAAIDLASEPDRNAVPMELLVTLYKALSAAGLAWVGHLTNSKSMRLLALLLGLMTVGGVLVDLTWFTDAIGSVTDRLAEFVSFSSQTIELAGLFLALAILAGGLVVAAFRATRAKERRAVFTLLALLALVGVFVGPVNAIAAAGINREWLFAEDFGQIVSMSMLAGYVAGLVVAVSSGSIRLSRHRA
ncbi:MAG: hypothetical protein GY722_09815 [bacterium]|nr:hypothetical protein [bacterium]